MLAGVGFPDGTAVTQRGAVPDFDLYRELEVDRLASTATIDAAWRSLVKRFHPDVQGGNLGADEKTRRLNVAHEWLSDPMLRAQFDAATWDGARSTRPAPRRGGAPPRPTPSGLIPQLQVSRRPVAVRLPGFYAFCLLSIGLAYVGAVVLAALVSFANIAIFAAMLVGADSAASIIQLLGNIVYAVLAGYLVTESYKSLIRPSTRDASLIAIGTVTVLALTFGFPTFASSYLPSLADWMVNGGSGLPAVIALSAIEALVAGSAVLALGLLQSDEKPVARV